MKKTKRLTRFNMSKPLISIIIILFLAGNCFATWPTSGGNKTRPTSCEQYDEPISLILHVYDSKTGRPLSGIKVFTGTVSDMNRNAGNQYYGYFWDLTKEEFNSNRCNISYVEHEGKTNSKGRYATSKWRWRFIGVSHPSFGLKSLRVGGPCSGRHSQKITIYF